MLEVIPPHVDPVEILLSDGQMRPGDLLRALFDNATDFVGVVSLDLKFVTLNHTRPGVNLSDVIGSSIFTHLRPEVHAMIREVFAKVLATGEPMRVESPTPDSHSGGARMYESRISPVRHGNETVGFVFIGSDVTDARRADAATRESEATLRLVLAATGMGIWSWDIPTDKMHWDRATCSMFGVSSFGEPRDLETYFSIVHPDDVERVRSSFAASVDRDAPFEIEHRVVHADGSIRWIHMQAVILRDVAGAAEKLLGGVMDTTRRHELEEQARHAQRMEVIGQLTAGIAHNFNNMLMGILPNLELALRRAQPDIVPLLKNAEHAGRRASDVVRQLMAFAGTTTSRRSVEELSSLIERTLDLCRRTFPASIEIDVIHGDSPPVLVDPSQLEHALLNILLNARDALMSSKKSALKISVELSVEEVSSAPVGILPGKFARIEVVDNGCGMSDETCRRIFEPFFTTKGPGSGTGLGLATAFAILREHQGWIDVASSEGNGSTFSLYLPMTDVMPTLSHEESPVSEAPRGTELILIVDDEPMVRMILGDLLEEAGYRILSAEHGDAAVKIVEQNVGKISLAILDLSMPGKPGNVVLRMLRAIDPALRFMFSTGQVPDAKVVSEAQAVLEKPFDSNTLREAVRRVLDQK